MVYQPELELDSGAIVAMEGLVRWRHPSLGQLKPADFLRIANQTGAIADIDAWVLRTGAAEVASWQNLRGPSRHLWLNVSLAQLRRPGLRPDPSPTWSRSSTWPRASSAWRSARRRSSTSAGTPDRCCIQLRHAGVSLAIDDFTSYYATLGAIASLPIDCVKIGQRYIRDVGDGRHDDTFVATVVERAHARGIYVVAEGVETWGESARLTELGCDRAHGFLFSSAQRPDRARWLLTQGTGWRGQTVTPEVHAIPFPSPPSASS